MKNINEQKRLFKKKKESIEFWFTCNCMNDSPTEDYILSDKYNKYFYTLCDNITDLLDYIAIRLIIGKFNPTDITCEFDSQDEYEEYHLNYIKDNFSDIINNITLEIMYYLAYKHCKYIFMETEVFGKYYNAKEKIPNKEYTGRFTPEIEYYLIDKLNVKKLYA